MLTAGLSCKRVCLCKDEACVDGSFGSSIARYECVEDCSTAIKEMKSMSSNIRFDVCTGTAMKFAFVASALALVCTTGCSTKNYVRSQTAPIVQQTNELDAKTATDHRNIVDTDERAQKGIAGAQSAAETADQHALAAGQAADTANASAQEAY